MEAHMEERILLQRVVARHSEARTQAAGIGAAARRKSYAGGVIVHRRALALFDTSPDE